MSRYVTGVVYRFPRPYADRIVSGVKLIDANVRSADLHLLSGVMS